MSRCLRFWDVAKCFCDCGQVMLSEMENGVRLAQLVECDWKARYSTDTYLNPRWGKWFFFQSTFGADSLMVSTQPLCPIACINISAHIKNPKHRQPYHCLDTWKYCTLIGMGSAALATAVPYPGKVTQIFHKEHWSTFFKLKKGLWSFKFQSLIHRIEQLHICWSFTSWHRSFFLTKNIISTSALHDIHCSSYIQ